MPKKITGLNFFQFQPIKNLGTPDQISRYFLNLSNAEFRPFNLRGDVYILQEVMEMNGLIWGSVYRIQMSQIPPSMNVEERSIHPLGIDDNSGLAKATCFIIDPQINLLVIEAGTGTTEKVLCNCLVYNSGKELPKMEMAVVIDPSQWYKLDQMKNIYSLETKITKISSGEFLKNNVEQIGFKELNNFAKQTNTDNLSLKVEVTNENRKKGKSLVKNVISGMVNTLLTGKETDEVVKLQVVGEDEENNQFFLDLITQRLKESIEYDEEERVISSFNIQERLIKIEEKYHIHIDSLRKSYGF